MKRGPLIAFCASCAALGLLPRLVPEEALARGGVEIVLIIEGIVVLGLMVWEVRESHDEQKKTPRPRAETGQVSTGREAGHPRPILNYPETPTRPWTRLDYTDLAIRVIYLACFASAALWITIAAIRIANG